ncbi:MAG: hypothetical protein ACOZHQ_06025 [Thermodesulfobacteriota bacterium]
MPEPETDNPAVLAERQDALTSLLVLLALAQAGDWRSLRAALAAPAPAPAADETPPPS